MINLPKFKIGNLEMNLIQGGMGVGISGESLASAVANTGGAGIISSVEIGLLKGYTGKKIEANREAFREEIRTARNKSPNGVIGVNIMYALTDYEGLTRTAAEENIDMIICGAGFAKDLPELAKYSDAKLIPIVSSGRAARIICQIWDRNNYTPDALIVEGPKAGGHLGFKRDQLDDLDYVENALEGIVNDTLEESRKYGDGNIPVIAAGGIYSGQDIKDALSWGASGVQMGTRFVTTKECDASEGFKNAYLNSKEEDLMIINSPVGLPGRAIKKGDFFESDHAFKCAYNCLKTCKPAESPYCIADALLAAQRGDLENGFAFAGSNAYKATPETCLDDNGKFITVETLMQDISDEYQMAK